VSCSLNLECFSWFVIDPMYKQLQSPQVHLIIIWTRSVNDENIENMQIQL